MKKLWKWRNEAIHEARAFQSDHLHESWPLAVEIESVEQLFLVVIVFALDHLDRADSVQELWRFASSYQLPRFAKDGRPADMPRFSAVDIVWETNLIGRGWGAIIDGVFKDRAKRAAQTG